MKHSESYSNNEPPYEFPTNGKNAQSSLPSHPVDQETDDQDQDGHARTHVMLVALLDKLETMEGAPGPPVGTKQSKALSRLLTGTPSGLMGFISNLGGAWAVVAAVGAILLKLLPMLPQATNGLFSIVFPFAIFTTAAAAIIAAGRWIKDRPVRVKFLAAVMACYGVATALYLLWISLGFLRFNTLPSGVLLAMCWYGAASILRKIGPEVREMWTLTDQEE